jgi:hypothetical protein
MADALQARSAPFMLRRLKVLRWPMGSYQVEMKKVRMTAVRFSDVVVVVVVVVAVSIVAGASNAAASLARARRVHSSGRLNGGIDANFDDARWRAWRRKTCAARCVRGFVALVQRMAVVGAVASGVNSPQP